LKEAHRAIVEETTAANLAKSEVSDLSRSLRIAKAEVVASETRLAEKAALADHFKESLAITNDAMEKELSASEKLLNRSLITDSILRRTASPETRTSPSVIRARALEDALAQHRLSELREEVERKRLTHEVKERVLAQEQLDMIRDLETARTYDTVRSSLSPRGSLGGYTPKLSPTRRLWSSDLLDASSMSMDEASLIRAKASAMAAAAQERLRVEEELFKSRLKAATDDV